jgi:hypothetical protein
MSAIIIGRGSARDPAALQLYTTSNRSFVENERPDSERPLEALKEARRIVKEISPTAKCRSLTAFYNCVGMALANRRTAVDIEHLALMLQDDGYRSIPELAAVEGDIVEYRRDGRPQHVGIVYELRDISLMQNRSLIDIWVLSQWGEDGEYLHKARSVPAMYGAELIFWSERIPEP